VAELDDAVRRLTALERDPWGSMASLLVQSLNIRTARVKDDLALLGRSPDIHGSGAFAGRRLANIRVRWIDVARLHRMTLGSGPVAETPWWVGLE
jgi:hypothetical protein